MVSSSSWVCQVLHMRCRWVLVGCSMWDCLFSSRTLSGGNLPRNRLRTGLLLGGSLSFSRLNWSLEPWFRQFCFNFIFTVIITKSWLVWLHLLWTILVEWNWAWPWSQWWTIRPLDNTYIVLDMRSLIWGLWRKLRLFMALFIPRLGKLAGCRSLLYRIAVHGFLLALQWQIRSISCCFWVI